MKTKEFQKLLELSHEMNEWQGVKDVIQQEEDNIYRHMTLDFLIGKLNETKRKEDK